MARPNAAARGAGQRPGTAGQILDAAERLIQTRGFNGFSYANIAAELGVTKASLHYHFRTKAELGTKLVERYTAVFLAALHGIQAGDGAAPAMLAHYARLYADVLRGERMCLCGMLAAEHSTLPGPMQDEIRRFFDANEAWLAAVLEQGREAGTLKFDGPPPEMGRLLLAALEGAMLVSRPYADVTRFESSAARLLDGLNATARKP
jgi:TetR/AcrR family transcriptional repressor of nem operon